jgi:hypothetical protein
MMTGSGSNLNNIDPVERGPKSLTMRFAFSPHLTKRETSHVIDKQNQIDAIRMTSPLSRATYIEMPL